MYKIANFAEDFENLKGVFLMNQYLLQMIRLPKHIKLITLIVLQNSDSTEQGLSVRHVKSP